MYANAPCRKEMTNRNDLQTIITQALEQMKREQGENFDPSHVNLAELERRTGISRARLRRLSKTQLSVVIQVYSTLCSSRELLTPVNALIESKLRAIQAALALSKDIYLLIRIWFHQSVCWWILRETAAADMKRTPENAIRWTGVS